MNKCPFCGNELTEENGKFCGSCGHPLTNGDTAVPVEAPVEPVEAPAAPTEAPVEPANEPELPVAPLQAQPSPIQGAAQPPVPGYNAPPQNMPAYGAMTQTAVKKNRKGMVLAIIVGAVVVLGLIAAALVFFSGGSGHELDGEYKLTGLMMGDQDYSSYISYLADGYHLKIDGSECTIEVAGSKTTAKIDQRNRTISAGTTEIVNFTVEGNDIILSAAEYTMTFTKQ